jgi:phosphonate transport system substrate-binding protein
MSLLSLMALVLFSGSAEVAASPSEKADQNPALKARKAIVIGFNLAEKGDLVEANGKRLSDYVKKKIGLEVNTLVAKDYASLVEMLKAGKLDFAFFPPFSLVKAEEKAGAHLLLKAVRRGRDVSYGAIIVRADSSILKLEDLEGKKIGWVDAQSATGYLIPKADLIRNLKVKPDTYLGKQTFLKTHDELVKAVLDGRVDAGATWVNDPQGKSGAWHRHVKNAEQSAQIRMIHVTSPLPGDALATTGKLWKQENAMVQQVTKVLQRMGEGLDGRQILRDLYGIDKMVPALPKDFDFVRASAKIVGER